MGRTWLQELNLASPRQYYESPVSSENAEEFVELIARLPRLSHLDISSIPFAGLLGAVRVADTIRDLWLVSFNTRDCGFGEVEWRIIGNVLKEMPLLSCLNCFEWSKSFISGGVAELGLEGKVGIDAVAVLMLFVDSSCSTLASLNM